MKAARELAQPPFGGDIAPEVEIIAYKSGYRGLLMDYKIEITKEMREKAHVLHRYGGSPIGNSRVKLTNVADCVKRGLVQEGQDPLHVAAEQLTADDTVVEAFAAWLARPRPVIDQALSGQ